MDSSYLAMNTAIKSTQSTFTGAEKAASAFGSKIKTTGQSIEKLRNKIEQLKGSRDKTWRTDHIAKYNMLIEQSEKKLKKLENLPPPTFFGRMSAMGDKFTNLTGLSVGLGSAVGAIGAVSGIVKMGMDMEMTNTSFEVLLGSTEKANETLGQLRQFADVSPFNTSEVITAGQTLLGFGVKSQNLITVMNRLGDASKGNANTFNSLVDNYGKMTAAQKANTTDLNQFATAGIPIWEELGKVMKMQGTDLRDSVEKNGVSMQVMDEVFKNMNSSGGIFFGMMDKLSKTTSGKLSTMMSKFEGMGIAIGMVLLPATNLLIDILSFLADYLDEVGIVIGTVGGAFGIYSLATNAAAIGTWLLNTATSAGTGIMGAFNAMLAISPLGRFAIAIGAVIAAVIIMYNKFDWFRGLLWGLWESVKTVWANIGNLTSKVFGAIGDVIKGALTLDVGLIGKGADKFKGAFNDFGNKTSKAYSKGFELGVKDFASEKKKAATPPALAQAPVTNYLQKETEKKEKINKSKANKESVDAITAGGSKSISIRFDNVKFAEKVEIVAQSMDGAVDDVKQKFMQMFAQVLNGAVMTVDQ